MKDLKSSIIQALQGLSPETITQDAPELTEAQVVHAVTLAFGELMELRGVIENIRRQAEDRHCLTFYREKVTQIVKGQQETLC